MNFTIKKFPINSIKDETLIEKVKDYISHNSCCVDYPNCDHPPIQSNVSLLFDERFKEVLEEIVHIIIQFYEEEIENSKTKHLKIRSWGFLQKKDEEILKHNWHNHLEGDDKHQYSFIMYLTPTNHGTLFINSFDVKQLLIPETGFIFFWDSKYAHAPDIGKLDKERIVIAGNVAFT